MGIYPLFFTLFCVPAFSLLLQWCRLAGIPLLFLTTLSFDGCFVPFSCHVLSRDDFFFFKVEFSSGIFFPNSFLRFSTLLMTLRWRSHLMFHALGCLLLCRSSMFTAFFSHIHLDYFCLPSAILFLWNLFLHITFFTLFKGFCCSFFWQLGEKECIVTLSSIAR